MHPLIDAETTFGPCAGEGLRDMVAKHAITLLADWDEERTQSPCAGHRAQPVTTDAEDAGGACAKE